MTAIETPTDKEADRRELPGDGKTNPARHIVRIVVVRPAAGPTPAVPSDGPGQSHGLTQSDVESG